MLTYHMDNRGGLSKYEYLYRQIKADIQNGTIKAGEKLPSKRSLAEHLGISVITVESAYGQLLDEGYIFTKDRSGFYVNKHIVSMKYKDTELYKTNSDKYGNTSIKIKNTKADNVRINNYEVDNIKGKSSETDKTRSDKNEVESLKEKDTETNKIWANKHKIEILKEDTEANRANTEKSGTDSLTTESVYKSPLPKNSVSVNDKNSSFDVLAEYVVDFPINAFTHIVRDVLSEYKDMLMERSPNAGIFELRSAIASFLKRYRGMSVKPDQIIIGSGSEYLYGFVAQLFDRDIIYGIEFRSYEKIRLVYSSFARSVELLPMDDEGVSSNALKETNARLLHVTPFHSFPTGITASASKRYEYLSWAKEKKAFIVEDDYESEFALPKKPIETIFSMDDCDSVIYLNTFTKSIAPSMRVGYMILPEKLLALYQKKLGFYSCTVPSLDQYILAEYINQGHFEKRLNRIRKKLRETV